MPSLDYVGMWRNPQSPAGGQTSLASGPVYNYSAPFGGNPTVPSPQGTQQQAIGGNISALGPLYNLGSNLNQFTAQQAPTSLNLNLPNYQQSNQVLGGNILSKLQGQVPQDVLNQIGQFGAERGVATGSIGSPNSNAAMLRALGLTSLDLQNQGAQQFSQAIAQTPQGAQFNPYSFLVSPQQQQEAQYQANLLNAAPVPSSAQYAGLNALQSGRQAGYGGGFPSSAPVQSALGPVYAGGQQPLGSTPYGSPTGSGTLTPYTGMTQSDLDYLGLSEPTSYTDIPATPDSGFNPITSSDMDFFFGDSGG